ncbi:hypothetical protein GA707_03820 [Nostocoides sp. F2B08]|uniref:hypothetical protein n=1 Tax=Nostocoides sp. F2B08 TaxID=2653936 RepID=UPI001262C185|nr:hypothetical protein [Tetrasphaera sp. F2B08]KAB7745108.1 hypothetical protein GA707_03820 [Tetrasphaera sp. F2B08]
MQQSAQPPWEIVERGVFAIGSCRVCGWQSPARRAYSTARREATEHGDVCPGPPSAIELAPAPQTPAVP